MRFIILLALVLVQFTSFCQQITLNITDSATQETLPFANVYLKNTGVGSSSNINGIVVFEKNKLLKADTFMVSYVGYKTKKVPYSTLYNKNTIQVKLSPLAKTLDEMVLVYEKPPKPEKIVKTAIKNTSKNYHNENVILKALYRESIEENGKYIQLNEAITKTHYTAYPQKKLDKTIWEDWFYNDDYAFDIDGNRFFDHLFIDYNTKKDQQEIIASRSSHQWSAYNLNSTIVGDPLNLLAMDKLKYQYDFLNPSILSKYIYTLKGIEEKNGEMCYVISFYPKGLDKNLHVNRTLKTKSAIYTGTIYITKKEFAVIHLEYKLVLEKNFGFYTQRVPLDYRGEITYKKYNNRYAVHSIQLQETRKFGEKENGVAILHKANRAFYVTNVLTKNVEQIPDSNQFKSTQYSSIRYYKKAYNPEYWYKNPLPKGLELSKQLRSDLEVNQPLNQQFIANKNENKHPLPQPIPANNYFAFNHHNTTVVDSLQWMALPQYETEFKTYLSLENIYTKNELIEDKAFQRKLFNRLNSFYPETEDSLESYPIGTYFFDENKKDESILYLKADSANQKPVFNISVFKHSHPSAYITKYLPNPSKTHVLIQYENVGTLGEFIVIYPFGTNVPIDTFNQVYSVEWFSDSTLFYTKTNTIGSAKWLQFRTVSTHKDSCVYTEHDQTFDVEIRKEKEHLFCTIQSKTENEIHLISTLNHKIHLTKIKQRTPFVNYNVKVNQGIYILVNHEKQGSYIEYINPKVSLLPKQITKPSKSNYITNFIPLKTGIIAHVYEKSIPKIKWIKQGGTQWKTLDFNLPLGAYNLISELKENNQGFSFQYNSPQQPYTLYNYHLNTKQLILKHQTQTNYSPEHYKRAFSVKRIWAKSTDGTKIPITYIKRRMLKEQKVKGLILKTYGAYGSILKPGFDAQDYILLNLGYAIAYAHVRGSGILGPQWYKQGRTLNKENSITDYLACAKHLVDKQMVAQNKLVSYGNSAGGIVVAQAINIQPELFNTVILDHPYLDVINTMMDETLPLTIDEYKEWGNPKEKDVYTYILSYSPYQNIKPKHYPNIYVTASYQDYQTPVWQVAKYIAKLRKNNLSNFKIVLLTDMNSGHQGSTQGKMWIKSFANMYSFLHLQLAKE